MSGIFIGTDAVEFSDDRPISSHSIFPISSTELVIAKVLDYADNNPSINIQSYDFSGQATSEVVEIDFGENERKPEVIALSNGDIVVAHQIYDQSYDSSKNILHLSLVDLDGGLIIDSLNAFVGEVYDYKIIPLTSGGFLLSYSKDDLIYIDRYSSRLELEASTIVNIDYTYGTQFDLAELENGDISITYYDYKGDNLGDTFFQIFSPWLDPVLGETIANTTTGEGQFMPKIVSLANGNFLITWQSDIGTQSGGHLFGQIFDENGQKIGGEFPISSLDAISQSKVKIVALDNGGFVVTANGLRYDDGFLFYHFSPSGKFIEYFSYPDFDNNSHVVSAIISGSETRIVLISTSEYSSTGVIVSVKSPLISTDFSDLLIGSLDSDQIDARDGDDTIYGEDGNDRIDGGNGNDYIHGDEGNDGLKGGDGDDFLDGGPGDDRLPAGDGNDTSFGGEGNDRLGGGFGNDYMDGGSGNDGGGAGPGSDTVIGGDGNDRFNGGYGSDYIDLGEGDDRSGASFGNDTMFGGSGNDLLTGGDGDDLILGDAGNDTINSGFGADAVTGGEGADQFLFNALFGGGTTVITDFEDGIDVMRVVGLRNPPDPVGRLEIQDTTYDGEAAATFTYGDHRVIVQGMSASDLTADDFLFT